VVLKFGDNCASLLLILEHFGDGVLSLCLKRDDSFNRKGCVTGVILGTELEWRMNEKLCICRATGKIKEHT
jgi:hypothetical protein